MTYVANGGEHILGRLLLDEHAKALETRKGHHVREAVRLQDHVLQRLEILGWDSIGRERSQHHQAEDLGEWLLLEDTLFNVLDIDAAVANHICDTAA